MKSIISIQTEPAMRKQLIIYLETKTVRQIAFLCSILIIVIGLADYFIGPEISSAIFYVLPISMGAWFGNSALSIGFSFMAALVWFVSNEVSGSTHSHEIVRYWNACARFILFFIIAQLLSGFRERFKEEEIFADTDPLTDAYNKRAFFEQIEKELERSKRSNQPFAIVYIDLDDFKRVNDTFGHTTGDELLKAVVSTIKKNIRKIDVVSRLGGDEFAIMFINISPEDAESTMKKIQEELLERMKKSAWGVTFSIGMITFAAIPYSVDEILNLADSLMYSVKKSGKNNISHSIWKGSSTITG